MQTTALPSEQVAIVGIIDPDAYGTGTYTTDWIDAAQFDSFMAIVTAGDLGASATLNAKIEQATTSGGTPKDVTSEAITALTQAGTDSNKQSVINLSADELDIKNNYRWFRLSMTVAVATSDAGAIVLGINRRFGPASAGNLTAVDEIVSV